MAEFSEGVSAAQIATHRAHAGFLTWLKQEGGYLHPKPIAGGRYAAITKLIYTHAIIVGRMGDERSLDDRWCYHDYKSAKAALDAWDGTTADPSGWHRHPLSGRRRPDGDPAGEYVAR